jgi:RNA polymerase sigma-70 factor (ECF subfamily)
MAPTSETDRRIIEEVRSGNVRAFAVLVDRYKDRAFSLALGLLGDRQEAEELVQDAFVRAFKGLSGFRGDAAFGTWYYRILHNLCLTRITRRGRKEKVFVELDEAESQQRADDQDDPGGLDRLEQSEMHGMVFRELDSLPEKFKSPLLLFYVEGMTYDEIASTLEIPVGTVKTNLFRGRNLLRMRLKQILAKEADVA